MNGRHKNGLVAGVLVALLALSAASTVLAQAPAAPAQGRGAGGAAAPAQGGGGGGRGGAPYTPAAGAKDLKHRHWRLGRDSPAVAVEVLVENRVAQDQHAPSPKAFEQALETVSTWNQTHGQRKL